MRRANPKRAQQEAEGSPVAWFCVLQRARQAGDLEGEAEARRRLRELGVSVEFTKGQEKETAGAA